MGKKINKAAVDQVLLDAVFQAEKEWKQIKAIIERSIDITESGHIQEAVARAKYLFLLREARHRKINALQK